jgi:hypothetical protein
MSLCGSESFSVALSVWTAVDNSDNSPFRGAPVQLE